MLQAGDHKENGGPIPNIGKPILMAMGANLTSAVGAPETTIKSALRKMEDRGVVIRKMSSLYHTPAFPPGAGPNYVNAAARITFDGSAVDLLNVLHEIEALMGRERVQRWGQRTLDLDLLAFGDTVSPDSETFARWRDLSSEDQKQTAPQEIILPHPRMQDRAFVLVPLADVAPEEWVHPVSGLTVGQMLMRLPQEDRAGVTKIDEGGKAHTEN